MKTSSSIFVSGTTFLVVAMLGLGGPGYRRSRVWLVRRISRRMHQQVRNRNLRQVRSKGT